MIIKLNKEQLKNILEFYYKNYENDDCEISFKVEKKTLGYGWYEYDSYDVVITKKTIKTFLNQSIEVVERLSNEYVKEVLGKVLREENLQVESIDFDAGISSQIEGYGRNEHVTNVAYFNGININFQEIGKQKVKNKR